MENQIFSAKDVFSAYKKFKHYVYYDSSSLFLRKKIAEFENTINVGYEASYTDAFLLKMEEIAKDISCRNLRWWSKYFNSNISHRITPKSFIKRDPVILTNKIETDLLFLDRVNIFIDATIEVHIISVLWIMFAGRYLNSRFDEHNYAYKLELNDYEDDQSVVNGLRLYKPYFIQYQTWRDKALKKAQQLLDEKKEVVILGLDIKDYFNSVKCNLSEIEGKLYRENVELIGDQRVFRTFELLNQIHITYTKLITPIKRLRGYGAKESVLPIGLLSSGLLGNLYMNGFDEELIDKLNPAYYGRYVDDLLFVFSSCKVEHEALYPVNNFVIKYFVERNLLGIANRKDVRRFWSKTGKYRDPVYTDDIEYGVLLKEAQALKFSICSLPNLTIQSKKVTIQSFEPGGSRAILNKFKKKIDENRSEFRFLPDEDELDKEFDEEAFSIHYSDSINKLRSIKEFGEDKYGASKYLAAKIYAAAYSEGGIDKQTTHQILTFFRGTIGLQFHTLWEKVVTYFVVSNQPTAILKFYRQISTTITRIDYSKLEDLKDRPESYEYFEKVVKRDLTDYLGVAISTSLALNPHLIFDRIRKSEIEDVRLMQEDSWAIRVSNMFRHRLISLPAVNYTNFLVDTSKYNLLNNIEKAVDGGKFELNERLCLLSPRYVHFHEFNILNIYKAVHSVEVCDERAISCFERILDVAFEDYWHINYEWRFVFNNQDHDISEINAQKKKWKSEYFEIEPASNSAGANTYETISVKSPTSKRSDINKKIAVANIQVHHENIERSIIKTANLSRERRTELFRLINLVEKEKCDLFVLPEVSIPHQWIKLLAERSYRRNLAIVAGLEHWINRSEFAFNFMLAVVPIKTPHYSTCLMRIRLKNHYSHEEKRLLKGYRLFIPSDTIKNYPRRYDLFHWRNVYFSVYNCFELAEIADRGLFKSKVDFIVCSEYNKDTAYFSDIAGSWVRDIHCYFVQVNSSDYGDSRILQPAKSFARDIIQIKGGENSTIVVGSMNIKDLRDFQLMEYELQKEKIDSGSTVFKPTPPEFDRENVKKRIENRTL
jgi:hypothetical protein